MLGAVGCLAVALPMNAHATTVTFDWVPISETPSSGNPYSGTSTATGSITLNISPWTLTPITGNGLGPNYYTSGSAVTATITALSYTFGNGVTVGLSDLSTTTIGVPNTGPPPLGTIWATSAVATPATGAQAPSAPTAGYYLITQFAVAGTVGGMGFMLGNNTGTAGANYQNGIGNGDNTYGTVPTGIEDGGYWELASATAVPLPAGLPLLLSGLGLLVWFARRGFSPAVARAASPT
jgi:hypothetical protein